MPYIDRQDGAIVAVYANRQYAGQEQLPEGHADLDALALEEARTAKRQAISAAARAAIEAGVVSTALGANHTYPTTAQDQANLHAQVTRATVGSAVDGTLKLWCADADGVWARRAHSHVQIVTVGEVVATHVSDQQDTYESLLIDLEVASDMASIADVAWPAPGA